MHDNCALSPACWGELGWGSLLAFEDQPRYPLPASPCKQGEEQKQTRTRTALPPVHAGRKALREVWICIQGLNQSHTKKPANRFAGFCYLSSA